MARQVVPKRKYPVAKVGSYAAEVDTVGMDEPMKAVMGHGPMGLRRRGAPVGKSKSPFAGLFKKRGKK